MMWLIIYGVQILNKFLLGERHHKFIFENWVKSGRKHDFRISLCNSFVSLLHQLYKFNYNLTFILLLVSVGFPSPMAKEHLSLETEVLFIRGFVIYSWLSVTNGTESFFPLSTSPSNIPTNLTFSYPKRTLNLKFKSSSTASQIGDEHIEEQVAFY